MKIVNDTNVISHQEAIEKVERNINNSTRDALYIAKYNGDIVSFSGEYYKFAWKKIGDVRRALSLKFGKELADALVENDIIEIVKVYI